MSHTGIAPWAFVVMLTCGCNAFTPSDYANCVVADDAGNFTGEMLQHDGKAKAARLLTTQCQAKDRSLDGGDGSSKGRVRWVVCFKGPDCDEAGMR